MTFIFSTIFIIGLRFYLHMSLCWPSHCWCKSSGWLTAGILAWIKALAPNFASSHFVLHLLMMSLVKFENLLILLNLNLWVYVFLVFSVMKSEHTKHSCIPKSDDCLHKEHLCIWHFFENEGRKPVHSRNGTDSICCQ